MSSQVIPSPEELWFAYPPFSQAFEASSLPTESTQDFSPLETFFTVFCRDPDPGKIILNSHNFLHSSDDSKLQHPLHVKIICWKWYIQVHFSSSAFVSSISVSWFRLFKIWNASKWASAVLGCGVCFHRKLVCFALDAADLLRNEKQSTDRGNLICEVDWSSVQYFSYSRKSFCFVFLLSEDRVSQSSISAVLAVQNSKFILIHTIPISII